MYQRCTAQTDSLHATSFWRQRTNSKNGLILCFLGIVHPCQCLNIAYVSPSSPADTCTQNTAGYSYYGSKHLELK